MHVQAKISVVDPSKLDDPRALLDLQEQILLHGGSYWTTLALENETVRDHVAASRQRLLDSLPLPRPRTIPLLRTWAIAATVLAAFLGLALVRQPPSSPTWGWNSPHAFAETGDRRTYLAQLARSADEWFEVERTASTTEALALRIGEFRNACTKLQFAPHTSLPDDDREWLKERCRIWSSGPGPDPADDRKHSCKSTPRGGHQCSPGH